MTVRYAYFYFMKNEPERIRVLASNHAAHWRGLELSGYVGGPFGDRGGGLITFEAGDRMEAERAVAEDPFLTEDLLEEYWLKEWVTD